ncbi:MAG: lyase HEAT-like repeat protein [Geminicoccaceae bacterium]|nr:lyase HEAT-like repeat protein [Geminicoccaceae bacterium]
MTSPLPPEGYPAPLDRVAGLQLDESVYPANVDYVALGIGPGDIPALIDIATDRRFDDVPVPVAWAPVHAWRALGQLRAADAAEPLTLRLQGDDLDDYELGDLPRALGKIGAPALPVLARYLSNPQSQTWSRVATAEAVGEVGQAHPDARDECVALLSNQLREFRDQDPTVNAFLVTGLLDLEDVEAVPIIEEVYTSGLIDESINGDWEDVRVELGLLPARLTPRRSLLARRMHDIMARVAHASPPPQVKQDRAAPQMKHDRAAEKRRRKIAKQSKRRNKRRK